MSDQHALNDDAVANAEGVMTKVRAVMIVGLVGGVHTLTMAPTAHFTWAVGGQLADVDIRRTFAATVGAVIYRPKLSAGSCSSRKLTLVVVRRSPPVPPPALSSLIKRWDGVAARSAH